MPVAALLSVVGWRYLYRILNLIGPPNVFFTVCHDGRRGIAWKGWPVRPNGRMAESMPLPKSVHAQRLCLALYLDSVRLAQFAEPGGIHAGLVDDQFTLACGGA